MFDSNEPHAASFPAPAHDLPKKAGSAIFGVGSYPDKDVEGWLRRMCILRCEVATSRRPRFQKKKQNRHAEMYALLGMLAWLPPVTRRRPWMVDRYSAANSIVSCCLGEAGVSAGTR